MYPQGVRVYSGLPQFKLERESSTFRDTDASNLERNQLLKLTNGTIRNGRLFLTDVAGKILPETPPISPPSALSPPASPPAHFKMEQTNGVKVSVLPTVRLQNGGFVKKLKIQPKPYSKQPSLPVQNGDNKKTILLSAQDFAALSKKVIFL